ncbi:hypothetical protein ACWWD9_08235 [Methylovorus sp. SPW-M1]
MIPNQPIVKAASPLERLSGGLASELTFTALAASIGTPLAALLPVLTTSLAAQRQKSRIEAALCDINEALIRQEERLAELTDQQYKIINESILALLHTIDERKIVLLTDVINNSLSAPPYGEQEVIFLSRIIRDISADEAKFLVDNFSYNRIWLSEVEQEKPDPRHLSIKPSSQDGQVALGLITLGLISTAEPTFDDLGLFRFTPMAAKLIALLTVRTP